MSIINLPENSAQLASRGIKKAIFGLAVLVVIMITWDIVQFQIIDGFTSLAKIKGNQIWPSPFPPVARFVANMDWETRTVSLDASMSKVYEGKVKKFLWRIDDGTGIVSVEDLLKHTFENPGYYTIKLSIIDELDKSDEATCLILIPPSSLQKVVTKEALEDSSETFSWVPEGTFFNYLKIDNYDRVPGTLRSPYMGSDCGLSTQEYNVGTSLDDLDSLSYNKREGLATLFTGTLELVVVGSIGFFLLRRLRAWSA